MEFHARSRNVEKERKNSKNAKRKRRISEEETFAFQKAPFVPFGSCIEIVQLGKTQTFFLSDVHLVELALLCFSGIKMFDRGKKSNESF